MFFFGDAALLRVHVPALKLDEPLARQLPQSRIERQRAIPKIAGQLPVSVSQRFLHDIGAVEAGGQALVQMKLHHASQPWPF
jgi:hypothetical protein